jgi:transposase
MLDNLVHRKVDWDQYLDLETIGIDEISNRKGRQDFIAVISVKDKHGDLGGLN